MHVGIDQARHHGDTAQIDFVRNAQAGSLISVGDNPSTIGPQPRVFDRRLRDRQEPCGPILLQIYRLASLPVLLRAG